MWFCELRGTSIGIITLLLLSLFANFTTGEETEPPSEDDYFGIIIREDTTIEKGEWVVNQNIIVKEGAVLTIINTTVMMDAMGETRILYVKAGAKLIMNGSWMYPVNNYYAYQLWIYGDIETYNTNFSESGFRSIYIYETYNIGGMIIVESSAYFFNTTFELNSDVQAYNSDLTIVNSSFVNCTYGIQVHETALIVDNCTFLNNFYDISIENSNDFRISNSVFDSFGIISYSSQSEDKGLEFTSSTGVIRNSSFRGKYYAVTGTYVSVDIIDCDFYFNIIGVYTSGRFLNISRTSFNYPFDQRDSKYRPFWELNKYAVFSESLTTYIDNSTFKNYATGIAVMFSTLYINDSVITNCSDGIRDQFGSIYANNITITKSNNGMNMYRENGRMSNSDITENMIGIQCFDSNLRLENNNISSNLEWGVVSSGNPRMPPYDRDLVELVGVNFPDTADKSYKLKANGIGNLAHLKEFDVIIKNSYDQPLRGIDISLRGGWLDKFKSLGNIYIVEDAKTDINGYSHLGWLVEYIIDEGYEKKYSDDYRLTASYKLTGSYKFGGQIEIVNSIIIDFDGFPGKTIELVMDFPDYYLVEDELELSSESVKEGEKFVATTVVHYSGPDGLTLPEINVHLYIDTKLIDIVSIDDLNTNNDSRVVELTWYGEKNVSNPNKPDQRRVKIMLEIPRGLEYDLSTDEYTGDNIVITYINISKKAEETPWHFSSNDELVGMGIFSGIVAIVLIILFTVRHFIMKRRKRGGELGEEPEEEEPKKGTPPQGRKPPGHPGKVMGPEPKHLDNRSGLMKERKI